MCSGPLGKGTFPGARGCGRNVAPAKPPRWKHANRSHSPHLRKSPVRREGLHGAHSCALSLIVFRNWLRRKTRGLLISSRLLLERGGAFLGSPATAPGTNCEGSHFLSWPKALCWEDV